MNDERGSWYLLTAIILGIGLGLLYSWVISPAEFIDTPPFSLRADFKDQYRAAIAAAFAASGDIQRAQSRLALLEDEDPSLELVAQAQRYLAEGNDVQDAQALARLAAALGQVPTPLPTQPEATATILATDTPTAAESATPTASLTPTPGITLSPTAEIEATATLSMTQETSPELSPTPDLSRTSRPSLTPTGTFTPIPSRTPTVTLAPPFVMDNQVLVCNPLIAEPQLQIFVSNAAGIGIPGVEIIVIWEGGEEHFFTGLKPDIDKGYADFVMAPDVAYTLQVADGGQLISNLGTPQCTDNNRPAYWGSWRLIFSHP